MEIFLIVDGVRRPVAEPYPGAKHAVAEGACPKCGATPLLIAGGGKRPSADDQAWEADGACLECRQPIGLIRAETGTLFGVREDEAVLLGRCRVY